MKKAVVTILISAVIAVVMADPPFREESCCKNPIVTKVLRKNYHNWKTLCGEKDLDSNCWADCVFKQGFTESTPTWQELLQNNIEKEPSADLQWKKDTIKNVIENCKNPNELMNVPCEGANDHIDTLRCGLRVLESSCPEGMWNTTDPLCAKH